MTRKKIIQTINNTEKIRTNIYNALQKVWDVEKELRKFSISDFKFKGDKELIKSIKHRLNIIGSDLAYVERSL